MNAAVLFSTLSYRSEAELRDIAEQAHRDNNRNTYIIAVEEIKRRVAAQYAAAFNEKRITSEEGGRGEQTRGTSMTLATDWTTDREGNEIREGNLVWVKSDTRLVKGIIVSVEIYRVQVQSSESGYLWAHVSDVTLAE